MNAALRWLHECAPGVDPWVEFRVGHPHHAPKDDDNV
jgi:hypothetical protein